MLVGTVDFQKMIQQDKHLFLGAYLQDQVYYLYPDPLVSIQEQPILEFLLTIFRSAELQIIHGKLNFTTSFHFSDINDLMEFRTAHPNASINSLPIQPFRMGFYAPGYVPSSWTDQAYEANWYSTQDANFLIYLDTAAAILINQTVRDNIPGFVARLDAFVEGLAPRFSYTVETDPKVLINTLQQGLAAQNGIFIYDDLRQFIHQQFNVLPFDIQPIPPDDLKGGIAQALLDRLFELFGKLYAGPANSNRPYIQLLAPTETGRLMLNLSELKRTKRPLTFQLDPFKAAQQVAQKDPNEVIKVIDTPVIPSTELLLQVNYFLPKALMEHIFIDLTLTVPPGDMYPFKQIKTLLLQPDRSLLEFKFKNNSFSGKVDYCYQLRLTYSEMGQSRSIPGPEVREEGRFLTLLQANLPTKILTVTLGQVLAETALLKGIYHADDLQEPFELSSTHPCFSYPILSEGAYISILAISLTTGKEVVMPNFITESTTIIGPNFPTYGSKWANIKAQLPEGTLSQTVFFQPEGSEENTKHEFTILSTEFKYTWFAPSIFETRFRYQIEGKEWSDYFESGQSINIQ